MTGRLGPHIKDRRSRTECTPSLGHLVSYFFLELSTDGFFVKFVKEIRLKSKGSTNRIAHSCIQNPAALQCNRGCCTLDAEG
jgi:hypothetical protein